MSNSEMAVFLLQPRQGVGQERVQGEELTILTWPDDLEAAVKEYEKGRGV
ncbi:MAG: hypothetical protein HQL73_07890 [Magnetococcales bacterium]|nr:hypothetical protein [Magnetococcales bacterium]